MPIGRDKSDKTMARAFLRRRQARTGLMGIYLPIIRSRSFLRALSDAGGRMKRTLRLAIVVVALVQGSGYLRAQGPAPGPDMTIDAATRSAVIDGALTI